MSSNAPGYAGHMDAGDTGNAFAQTRYVVEQMLAQRAGSTVVKVVGVNNGGGGTAPSGFVDVVPQVHQIDGAGQTMPHGTIYHLPYSRAQGGTNAVIMDPKVGDLGIVVFADRDISAVKNTRAAGPPGSRRMSDMSDGMYVGGILNGTPTQYVMFEDNAVTIVSPTEIKLQAPKVTVTSDDVHINGTSLHHNSKNVGDTHTHIDPQGGNTQGPNP